MKLKVSEVFYSVQGEGARAGEPSIFVRLSGCDLACGFCDTEFVSGREVELPELDAMMNDAVVRATGSTIGDCEVEWIVWTGGEPTLQLTAEVVAWFKSFGWKQAIETNGNRPVPQNLDWVACSPKVAEHVLAKNFPNGVDELRYVRHAGQPGVPEPSITAKRYFLSPRFDGENPNLENIKHVTKLCLANPKWTLSLQAHKLAMVL